MELISDTYKELNKQLHETNRYGKWGYRQAQRVRDVRDKYLCETVLDFGAGQCTLSKSVDFPVTNYDPAIEGIDQLPGSHDLVVVSDVMEHIEPEHLENVLSFIKSVTDKVVYFVIATTEDGTKVLPDGRDPHLIVKSPDWWLGTLFEYFHIKHYDIGKRHELIVEATP